MEDDLKEITENNPNTETQSAEENISQSISQDISSDAEYQQQNQAAPPPDFSHQTAQKAAAEDILKLCSLMQAGIVTPLQGQNLMQQVIQRAYNVITNQGRTAVTETEIPHPEFFKREARSEVWDYLKKSNVADKDEISQITKMVEKIEKAAVDDYLKKMSYEKTLNDENEAAKQKLTANAKKPSSGRNTTTVFTRDQIGKMSGAEFAKNERAIMEQLKKGLIR